jgi:hypothetical protein
MTDHILSRRQLLRAAAGAAVLVPALPARALATTSLLDRARAALDRHGAMLAVRDRLVLVDFSAPSSAQRLSLVDLGAGTVRQMLVAHGRGSDPAHRGWVERFSNQPGSYASSSGAYAAAGEYQGGHGRSLRLRGLDSTNDNAMARAIVVHAAWYVDPLMARTLGKIGRSEGCFAVASAELPALLGWMRPGMLLFADKG